MKLGTKMKVGGDITEPAAVGFGLESDQITKTETSEV